MKHIGNKGCGCYGIQGHMYRTSTVRASFHSQSEGKNAT